MQRQPKKKTQKVKTTNAMPVLQTDAAGIDIGATEHYVAVPADRDERPVRRFGAFTEELHALADWLKRCGVRTVAMESTGVYWIALFQVLETRGFEVYLVNARHLKNVPGRKTDVVDCQWLQYLHSVGLLRGSYRPPDQVCAVRTVLRHRDRLVEDAASHVQRMQKALTQMNLHLHHVISDLTGATGTAIIEAILEGERDPQALARHRDRRIKATEATIAKALVGDYRSEHLFVLRQNHQACKFQREQIKACDGELERLLAGFDAGTPSRPDEPAPAEAAAKPKRRAEKNSPGFDLHSHLHRIYGVDLTRVDGLGVNVVHTLFTELGADLSGFPTSKHFCSWLGLCPDNRISGGKLLSASTRQVPQRAARAFRLAAQSAGNSRSPLGDYHRRMRTKLGPAKANTATAHRIARIYYALVSQRRAFDAQLIAQIIEPDPLRQEKRLRAQARALGFTLVPSPIDPATN
jgi:transposase